MIHRSRVLPEQNAQSSEARCVETEHGSHVFRFVARDGREHGFSRSHFVQYAFRKAQSGVGRADAEEEMVISFSGCDVIVVGTRLEKLRTMLTGSVSGPEGILVRARDARYANYDGHEPFVTDINVVEPERNR